MEIYATLDGPKWTAQSGNGLWCEKWGVRGGEYIGTPDGPKWTAQREVGVGEVVERGGIGPEVNAPDGPKWTARSGALGGWGREGVG